MTCELGYSSVYVCQSVGEACERCVSDYTNIPMLFLSIGLVILVICSFAHLLYKIRNEDTI